MCTMYLSRICIYGGGWRLTLPMPSVPLVPLVPWAVCYTPRYDCEVHGFDPSDAGLASKKAYTTGTEKRKYHTWGLGGKDGDYGIGKVPFRWSVMPSKGGLTWVEHCALALAEHCALALVEGGCSRQVPFRWVVCSPSYQPKMQNRSNRDRQKSMVQRPSMHLFELTKQFKPNLTWRHVLYVTVRSKGLALVT